MRWSHNFLKGTSPPPWELLCGKVKLLGAKFELNGYKPLNKITLTVA